MEFDSSLFKCEITWDMSLNKDGSYSMVMWGDSDEIVESAAEMMLDALLNASDMTKDEFAAQYGMSWSQLKDYFIQEMMQSDGANIIREVADGKEESGYYTVDGDTIYLLKKEKDEPDEDYGMTFERKGSKLVITGISADAGDFDWLMEDIFPVTFKKS